MNISPQLGINNSVNDSLEYTFVEKNWKMQIRVCMSKR